MTVKLKPYPATTDSGVSWLGEIPKQWDCKHGFIAYREKQEKNIGLIENTVLSLSYGRIVIKPAEKLHGLVPESFETYQIVNPGDIIIRPTDLQNDWNSLRVGLAQNRGIITSAYLCLRTTDVMSPEYGYYLLHAYDLKKIFYGMGSGLRQNLSFEDFKRMPVPIPTKDEQAAIVRFLKHAHRQCEHYIRAKKKLIGLLNEQKQGIIHKAVTRGLNPDVKLKHSGIEWLGDIPAHWNIKRLKYIAKITPSKSELHKLQGDTSVTFLPMDRIGVWGQIDTSEQVKLADVKSGFTYMCNGDVIVAKITPCFENGKGALCSNLPTGIAFASTEFHVFRPRNGFSGKYLYYLTRNQVVRKLGEETMRGSAGQQRVPIEFFSNLYIPVPEIAEQVKISDYIEKQINRFDFIQDHIAREIKLIREYRTSLIADVVTGKLDVRKAVANLPNEPIEQPEQCDSDPIGNEPAEAITEEAIA